MENQSYERQVQAMAVNFAKQLHPAAFADRSLSVQDSNLWHIKVDNYKSIARMAVAEKANGIREYVINCAAIPCDGSTAEQYLKEQGLVPDDAKEGGSDGKE